MPPKQRRGTFTLPAKRAGGGPSAASTRSAPSGLPKAGGTGVNRKGCVRRKGGRGRREERVDERNE